MALITKTDTSQRNVKPVGVTNNIFVKMGELNDLVDRTNNSILTNVLTKTTPVAKTASATLTAAEVASGCIAVTSASAVALTLPTGTLLGTYLGASQGTTLDLVIDNTASTSVGIVTIGAATNGILSALGVAVAASAGLLTVPVGVTGMATFRIMFSSATAYTFTRIA